MKDIAVINACCDLGVHIYGADLGPEIITREIDKKNKYTIKTKKYEKEFDQENKRKNLEGVNEFNNRLYEQVKEVIQKEYLPMTIGGDHGVAIGSALASISEYENMGIIWFDAHGDFNTFDTTVSGNIHGLPLAALTHCEEKELTTFHHGNYYAFQNAVIVGGRDIEPEEMDNIRRCGVTVFTTHDIKQYGVKEICRKAFAIASNGTNGVHISFDVDLIDPEIAPGVSIPAPNGINLDEANEIVDEMIQNRDVIKSIDIVEFNPLRDKNKITENITKTIFYKLYENLLKKQ